MTSEIVNHETGEIVSPMDADEARRLTERIRIAAANYTEAKAKILGLIDEARDRGAWAALGYKSWTAYLSDVLSDEPLRLARDERRDFVAELANQGMSTRAIAPIVGVSHQTVRNDIEDATVKKLTAVPDVSCDLPAPKPIVRETTGLDGVTRITAISGEVKKPRRTPLTDTAREVGLDLRKVADRVARLATDDRFDANKDEVAAHLRSHLTHAAEVLADLLDRINN